MLLEKKTGALKTQKGAKSENYEDYLNNLNRPQVKDQVQQSLTLVRRLQPRLKNIADAILSNSGPKPTGLPDDVRKDLDQLHKLFLEILTEQTGGVFQVGTEPIDRFRELLQGQGGALANSQLVLPST